MVCLKGFVVFLCCPSSCLLYHRKVKLEIQLYYTLKKIQYGIGSLTFCSAKLWLYFDISWNLPLCALPLQLSRPSPSNTISYYTPSLPMITPLIHRNTLRPQIRSRQINLLHEFRMRLRYIVECEDPETEFEEEVGAEGYEGPEWKLYIQVLALLTFKL